MRDDRIQYTRHPNLRQHVISRFKNRTNHALPNPDISLATDTIRRCPCQEAPCPPIFEATHSTNSSYDRAAGTPYDERRGGVALELGARGRPSSDENGHELHFLEGRDPRVPTRPGSGWRSARAVGPRAWLRPRAI